MWNVQAMSMTLIPSVFPKRWDSKTQAPRLTTGSTAPRASETHYRLVEFPPKGMEPNKTKHGETPLNVRWTMVKHVEPIGKQKPLSKGKKTIVQSWGWPWPQDSMQLTNFFKESCTGEVNRGTRRHQSPSTWSRVKTLRKLDLISLNMTHIITHLCFYMFLLVPWSLEDLHQQEIEVHTEAEPHRIVVNGLIGLITRNRSRLTLVAGGMALRLTFAHDAGVAHCRDVEDAKGQLEWFVFKDPMTYALGLKAPFCSDKGTPFGFRIGHQTKGQLVKAFVIVGRAGTSALKHC